LQSTSRTLVVVRNSASAYPTRTSPAITQPAVLLRKTWAIPLAASSWILIVATDEALVVRMRTTPDQMSSPASVTTKDGTPALVMTSAWTKPIAVVHASANAMAAHQGQPGSSGRRRSVIQTPPTALT